MAFPFDFNLINVDDRFSEGERSNIRRFRVDDPDEVSRMVVIENDPGVMEFVEGLQANEEDLKNFGRGDEERLPVAIAGKQGFVDELEVDKLQGWVYFYPDEEERLERLKRSDMETDLINDRNVVEISYAKYPGAAKGQMSSGVRQAIKTMYRECARYGVRMAITAYTDRVNFDSKRLLIATGFRKVGEIEYHEGAGKKDDVWVLAVN